MKVLVTGGAGFIGSAYVRMARRRRPGDLVVTVDALTYAGNLENLAELRDDPRHLFVRADIRDRQTIESLLRAHGIDAILNFAAESHVDRSIQSAAPFLDTNTAGTLALLEAARATGVRRFLQVSTDEVYGSAGPQGRFDEAAPLSPRSPYAASKAAADHFVMAFHHTHGLDVVITRSSNNYGPYQYPEKLIPVMVLNALAGTPLPVYGDGQYVRDWIHVDDNCDAVDRVLLSGAPGQVYNVGAGNEQVNLEIVRAILALTGRDESLIRHVPDRPGHDRRYALDARKLRDQLGWRPQRDFSQGLAETVAWYRDHGDWLARLRARAGA
jgi:dTDP-glucose 4,6-dehydratase